MQVLDSAFEPEDELRRPPPEWIECYRTGDHAEAELLTGALNNRGIRARLNPEPRAVINQMLAQGNGVFVRAKDLRRARRLIEKIAKRRARRRGSTEFPWHAFAPIALLVFTIGIVAGSSIGHLIDETAGWDNVCLVIGGGLGFLAGLVPMIWLYRIRKRADAGCSQAGES
jgi:hypothetical protein